MMKRENVGLYIVLMTAALLIIAAGFKGISQHEQERYAAVAASANPSLVSNGAYYSDGASNFTTDFPPVHMVGLYMGGKPKPHIYSSKHFRTGTFVGLISTHQRDGNWVSLYKFTSAKGVTKECGYRYLHNDPATRKWVYKSRRGSVNEKDCWELIQSASDIWYNNGRSTIFTVPLALTTAGTSSTVVKASPEVLK